MNKDVKYIFSFDVESNGLCGEAFAVGLVVIEIKTGEVVDSLKLKTDTVEITDEFVKEHIVPKLSDLEIVGTLEMYRQFFDMLGKYQDDSIILTDAGIPVESNFLNKMTLLFKELQNDIEIFPYPIIDLMGVLNGLGHDPDLDRFKYTNVSEGYKHNPYYDALTAAIVYMDVTGQHS